LNKILSFFFAPLREIITQRRKVCKGAAGGFAGDIYILSLINSPGNLGRKRLTIFLPLIELK